jgi:coenzyme F420-dependent glucose-6-phosphate dehydrogenase
MDEALQIIGRLLDGQRFDHDGLFFRTKAAYLHTRGERRPPVYVSAFGPQAATVAGRLGDPGEIILQAGFSWAEDDDAALEGARVWKSTQMPEYFTDDWSDPQAMYENAERQVSDDDFKGAFAISSDPEHHVERVREVESLGATVVCLQNASGADPLRALETYGESVLPRLRARSAG